uniref:Uncharacterized protein n=1 Tax=Rhizophora mucronata TaxID=61149 RepID=A0A2P2LAE9_RHIMU
MPKLKYYLYLQSY